MLRCKHGLRGPSRTESHRAIAPRYRPYEPSRVAGRPRPWGASHPAHRRHRPDPLQARDDLIHPGRSALAGTGLGCRAGSPRTGWTVRSVRPKCRIPAIPRRVAGGGPGVFVHVQSKRDPSRRFSPPWPIRRRSALSRNMQTHVEPNGGPGKSSRPHARRPIEDLPWRHHHPSGSSPRGSQPRCP